MARYDIVTDGDIEAYVDGAVHGHRRRAVERDIARSERKLGRAVELLRLNADLRQLKESLYRDMELRGMLQAILHNRSQ